jgi:hypothetical protein
LVWPNFGVTERFSAIVGTAVAPDADGVVVVCANAVSGVTQTIRIKDLRTMLIDEESGKKPAQEICVVIDSGGLSPATPIVNAMSPEQLCDPREIENVPQKVD